MSDWADENPQTIKKPPADFLYPAAFQTCLPKLKIEPKMMCVPVKPDFLAEFAGSALEILSPLNVDAIPNFQNAVNSLNPIDPIIISDFCSETPTTVDSVTKELSDIEKNILFGAKAVKFDQNSSANEPKKTGNAAEKDQKSEKSADSAVLNKKSAKIVSVKPLIPFTTTDSLHTADPKLTRLIFENDCVLSEKAVKSFILNTAGGSVYDLFSRGSEDGAALKRSQRFLKGNAGGPPPPKRQNVVAVGEDAAVLLCLSADLRLRLKPRVDGEEFKEETGGFWDEIVCE